MEWIDTHCHLDEDAFTQDCEEVVTRAVDAGVKAMLAVGITLESCRRVLELAERFPQVHAIVGLHPNYVAAANPGDWEQIVALAKSPKVVGLGETGLDQYWDHSPIELQAEFFDRHLELSRELDLPFVVHCRDAEEAVIKQLKTHAERGPLNGVMHSFCGSVETAHVCMEMGMSLSISGMVTFKKNETIRKTVATIPLDRLLIETDAPYLAPTPFRGKRNEPAHVRLTAACLAEIRGVSKEEIAEATTANARRIFRLPVG
ncbi:TatD family hydrolase [Schlesneria sp. T3-172]|uniref:TatD family hydrolase n=1 Tax=Schlesneria TaxID=656899 RepID=UPI002F13DB78